MEPSRTFKDALDREWTIEISLANARRMKDEAGIAIEQFAPDMSGNTKSQQAALEPVVAFLGDPFACFAAFYGLCKPQADKLELTRDQVLEGFPDDASVERMVASLLAAVCHFFRKSPQKLVAVKMLIRHFTTFLERMNGKVNDAIASVDIGKLLDGLSGIDADKLNADLADRLRSSATESAVPSS